MRVFSDAISAASSGAAPPPRSDGILCHLAPFLCDRLCGGDVKRDVRIDVWDKDSMTKADPIGLAQFHIERLLKMEQITLLDYKVRWRVVA